MKILQIKYAEARDFQFLKDNDQHAKPMELVNLINLKRVLIAKKGSKIIGWLRWNLFWDNTPFLNLVFVDQHHRHQGVGTSLMKKWEELMQKENFARVMTTASNNKQVHHFYHKLGFQDSGSLLLPQTATATILRKEI